MKIAAADYLRLVERSKTLAFVDLEASGLRGDYNSVLVVSIRPYGSASITYKVRKPGDDESVVRETKACMETFDCWCTYYGKSYDLKMLNTRLLRWGSEPIEKRHHIDLYYTLKSALLTARRSQGHLLSFLETPEEKMSVSAEEWNRVLADPARGIPKMVARCESDTAGLQALYRRTKHLIADVTR